VEVLGHIRRFTLSTTTNFAGGCDPNGLLTGPNGSFYGTASSCGANNGGVVFKLTPPANGVGEWTQTPVHTFSALKTTSDGNVPYSRLVQGKGGVLFGTTYQGGSANLGTVYELTPKTGGTWTERVIHSFHTDGSHPQGAVSVGPNGVLYVTASSAGVSGGGSVIQLTPPGDLVGSLDRDHAGFFSHEQRQRDGIEPNGRRSAIQGRSLRHHPIWRGQ
jgi:uncharacterized repeat protein (TIGR03803 family)